jgi:hypothetical protein
MNPSKMSSLRKTALVGLVVTAVGTGIGFVACGDSPTATTPKGNGATPLDGGGSCSNPLPIQGMLPAKSFPDGRDFVAISGDPSEEIPEGGFGALRADSNAWDLAMRVEGKPIRLPNSRHAIHILAEDFPGTESKLIAFSHTELKNRGTFAGKVLYEPNRSGWSLEIQLVDPSGFVASKATIKKPGESVVPFDLAVSFGPKKAAILVQWDKRGITDTRTRGGEDSSTMLMQVLELTLNERTLDITEGPREVVTKDDVRNLMSEQIYVPKCSDEPGTCGPVPAGDGSYKDCGACPSGQVCKANRCLAADDAGACVPATKESLCPALSCGKRYDGCLGVVDCGGCGPGLECGGGEEVGKCADPFVLTASDVQAQFGAAVCGCFADDKGKTIEVGCREGQRCENSVCVGTATAPDPNALDLLDAGSPN